jgi:hypothetical protein
MAVIMVHPGNAMAHISGWPTHGVDNAGPILANQAMVDHHAPVPKDKIGLIDEFIIGFCEELPPDNSNRGITPKQADKFSPPEDAQLRLVAGALCLEIFACNNRGKPVGKVANMLRMVNGAGPGKAVIHHRFKDRQQLCIRFPIEQWRHVPVLFLMCGFMRMRPDTHMLTSLLGHQNYAGGITCKACCASA